MSEVYMYVYLYLHVNNAVYRNVKSVDIMVGCWQWIKIAALLCLQRISTVLSLLFLTIAGWFSLQ